MAFRFLKTAHAKVADFRKGRKRQTDDEFFAECGLPDNSKARRVALGVRHAAANVGLVDSQYIRVEDDYPGSLELLPLWDSMDWLEFVVELENELGEKVPYEAVHQTGDSKSITVAEMAAGVYAALMER